MRVKGIAISKKGDEDEAEMEGVQKLADASPEVQSAVYASLREAIREGKFVFSDQAKQQMAAKGTTEEEVLEMIMKQAGLDS